MYHDDTADLRVHTSCATCERTPPPPLAGQRLGWGLFGLLAVAAVGVAWGAEGVVLAAICLPLGWWAGWTYREHRDH